MPRLFVAVVPPDDVLDVIEHLPRPAEPGVRYTTRPQWHVTLRFFGEPSVDDAVTAFERVDAVAVEATLGPQVSRLGRNVVVVPVSGLESLAEAVRRATAGVGEPPDPRGFSGHLTVARLRARGACRIAGSPISARFDVRTVHLVSSRLDRGGARYEIVATRALSAGG